MYQRIFSGHKSKQTLRTPGITERANNQCFLFTELNLNSLQVPKTPKFPERLEDCLTSVSSSPELTAVL